MPTVWLVPDVVLKADAVHNGSTSSIVYWKRSMVTEAPFYVLVSQLHDTLHLHCPLAACTYSAFRQKLERQLPRKYVVIDKYDAEMPVLQQLQVIQNAAPKHAAVEVR
jgi:hypothetical protein